MKVAESAKLIGHTLEDRYEILHEIGRGGMGVVYEAEHTELGKRVAVKVILEKYANDDEAIIRFKREALAASRIGSPHIIDVSHIGTGPDGRPFVVMELLEGEPLASLLLRTGPMQPWRAIHIMRQVLRATGAAHAKGIVHRDLKPDNIFIVNRDDQPDFVKLLDFGISKFLDTGEHSIKTQLTTTGAIMGTPLYMAPEQAMGAPVAPSIDIYACGVILFEMLAGRPPFNDSNYNLLVAKLLTASPPHLGDLRKGLPRALIDAVHRALEKEPTARFASAEAFLAAIPSERAASEPNLELATTLAPGASLSVPPPTQTARIRGRTGWWVAGGLALIAGGVLGAAAIFLHGTAPVATIATPAPMPAPSPTTPAPAPTGTLEIKTIPPNASIRLDGADAGTSPIEVVTKPGRHRIRVELDGYTGLDVEQDVRTNERTSATFTLLVVAPPLQKVTTTTTTPPVITKHKPATGFAVPQNPYGDGSAATVRPPPPPPPTPTSPTNGKPNPY